MRKGRGPRARLALAGALALLVASSSTALGMARPTTAISAMEGHPPSVTLGAILDRAAVAPYQESARESALLAVQARRAAAAAARAAAKAARLAAAEARAAHARAVAAAAARARLAQARTALRDHLWIPSLHISQTIIWYACGRTSALANRVYRWGCAGHDNVYLMGHAWGVFKPLHDAYVDGQLRKGLVAYWSDAYGRVTRFEVTAWQVVSPSNTHWAIAAQSKLSMTLQTCMGTDSRYRLDVRLVSF